MDIELAQLWQYTALLIGLAVLAWATWRNPIRGAQAVVFLLPTYLLRVRETLWVPTNVLELLIGVFALVVLVRVAVGRDKLLPLPLGLSGPLLLIVSGAVISAIFGLANATGNPELLKTIAGTLKGFILVPVAFIVLLSSLRSLPHERGPTSLMRAYVWSAVAVAGFALLGGALSELFAIRYSFILSSVEGLFANLVTFDGRLRGIYLSPNHLAMYIMPAILLIAGMAKIKNQKSEVWKLALLVAALLWTQSAGAIIGLIGGLAWLVLGKRLGVKTEPPRLDRGDHGLFAIRYSLFALRTRTAIAGMLLLGGLAIPFLGGALAEKAWSAEWRSPTASRLMIWRVATELTQEHPVFGIGPGAFQHHYLAAQEKFPPYLEWAVPQPHNLMLAVWLQTGLLGLVGFVWLVFSIFRKTLNAKPSTLNAIAVSAALVAVLIHGFVDTPVFKNDLAIMFLLATLLANKVPQKTHSPMEPS